MSSNHHDETGPSFSRLSYSYEWRNECRALSANPKKFLNADTFSFVEPRACGPPLSVDSIGWICQVKENVRSSKDGASPIYRSRSGAKTNTPATYCTGPSTRHSTFVESTPSIALEQLSGWKERRPHNGVSESNLSIPRWPSFVDRIFNEWKQAPNLRGLLSKAGFRAQAYVCLVSLNASFSYQGFLFIFNKGRVS